MSKNIAEKHLPKSTQNTPSGSLSPHSDPSHPDPPVVYLCWFNLHMPNICRTYAVPQTGSAHLHHWINVQLIPAGVKSRKRIREVATMFKDDLVQCVKCCCWHFCFFHRFSFELRWRASAPLPPCWAEICFVAKLLAICATPVHAPKLIGKNNANSQPPNANISNACNT